MINLAVFVSGGGSNLQALIDRFHNSDIIRIKLVVSDRPGVMALQRAERAGIEAIVVTDGAHLLPALQRADIDLIALAGYLKLVPADVIRHYRDRVLNIHPALLPDFGGKDMYGARVHKAVLDAGARKSGATVHYVTEEYDRGSIIEQRAVDVLPGDTPETLAARVLEVEHQLYPDVVEKIARKICRQH